MLATRVSAVLIKRNRSGMGLVDAGIGAGAQSGGTLKLAITHVLGAGGGAWSGPRPSPPRPNCSRVRPCNPSRSSTDGREVVWGASKGACLILDRVAIKLATELGRWSFDPTFKPPEDEPMPKEGDSTAPRATETKESEVPTEAAQVPGLKPWAYSVPCHPTRQILSILVPPGEPMGSPQVMAYTSPVCTMPRFFKCFSASARAVSRSALVSISSGRTLR
jgi:hypothetical protein